MNQEIQQRKAIVRWGLIVILGLDVVLAAFDYRLNVSPHIAPMKSSAWI